MLSAENFTQSKTNYFKTEMKESREVNINLKPEQKKSHCKKFALKVLKAHTCQTIW